MKLNKIFFILFLLFIWSCSEPTQSDETDYGTVDIYDVWKQNTPLEEDENGYFHFNYPDNTENNPSDYGTLKYVTEIPVSRVFWSSPDSFTIYHMGISVTEPVINYSTYSGSDGYGQQLFYVYPPHIGDTLTLYGHLSSSSYDSVLVIIDE